MKQTLKRRIFANSTAALVLAGLAAHAQETRYISDTLLVAVRAEARNDAAIVHRGLPSGTAVLSYARGESG
ncbi:MAG: hypothetical protein VW202_02375, partial [Halieaceae bacterium]